MTQRSILFAAALAAVPAFAVAQDTVTLQASQSDEYGQYLSDADGRAVYMFSTDTQGKDDTQAAVSCDESCQAAWPPVTGTVEAGDGVDKAMLGTVDYEGKTVATYNGWPLYWFAKDEGADSSQGQEVQGFGGEWYLVSPEGTEVEGKK